MTVLFGREPQTQALRTAFERVADGPSDTFVLVGPPGSGKSTLASTLRAPVLERGGYFVTGKAEQFTRERPYGILSQAFRGLVEQKLKEPADKLLAWRRELSDALGNEARVLVDVFEELEEVLGPQPELQILPPAESSRRFSRCFRAFIGSITRHTPLVVFLDDLQWADVASVRVIRDRIFDRSIRRLLFVGTSRTAVADTHDLGSFHAMLDELRRADLPATLIDLGPLTNDDVKNLLTNQLTMEEIDAAQVAEALIEQTKGNALFVQHSIERLRTAREVGQHGHLPEALPSVADLIAEKMRALPDETVSALSTAACLGNLFRLRTLAMVRGEPMTILLHNLGPAIDTGLISRTDEAGGLLATFNNPTQSIEIGDAPRALRFSHDKIQQVAYDRMPVEERQALHRKTGRMLLAHTPALELERRIYEIVDHLNRAPAENDDERFELARLNHIAARRARRASAFQMELGYLQLGTNALPETAWDAQFSLTYEIWSERLSAAIAGGRHADVKTTFEIVFPRARTKIQKTNLLSSMMRSYSQQSKHTEAFEAGLQALELWDMTVPTDPDVIRAELERYTEKLAKQLDKEGLKRLLEKDILHDREERAKLELLTSLSMPAWFVEIELSLLMACIVVDRSLEHGITPSTAHGLASYPVHPTDDKALKFETRRTAFELSKRFNDGAVIGRTMCLSIISGGFIGWDFDTCVDYAGKGFRACIDGGDIQFGSVNLIPLFILRCLKGDDLRGILRDTQPYLDFLRDQGFMELVNELQAIRIHATSLVGEPLGTIDFQGDDIPAESLVTALEESDRKAPLSVLLIFRMREHLVLGNFAEAWRLAEKSHVMAMLWHEGIVIHEHHFLRSLIASRLFDQDELSLDEVSGVFDQTTQIILRYHQASPGNFCHKLDLVRALEHQANKRTDDARVAYATAISSALDSRRSNDIALVYEYAADFEASVGEHEIAARHRGHARAHYAAWGAQAKLKLLPESDVPSESPQTDQGMSAIGAVSTIGTIASTLATNGDIKSLLEVGLETTGAQRIAVVRSKAGAWHIQEQASDSMINKTALAELPAMLLSAVDVGSEGIHLHDAKDHEDPYLNTYRPGEVVAVPARFGGHTSALLYLEHHNEFAAHTQTWAELLAAQVAMSMDKLRVEQNLEATKQRLEGANRRLGAYTRALEAQVSEERSLDDLIGQSPAFSEMVRRARQISHTDSPVLLIGEPGTGKTTVARAIHRSSARSAHPFVKINCKQHRTQSAPLALFGSAGTMGRVELADRGTLYLEDVHQLPLETQDRLLSMLEQRQFERVGSTERVQLDVRIIASTSKSLAAEVSAGRFREDLYYRLNVVTLPQPSLRNRRADIPLLVDDILARVSKTLKKTIDGLTPESLERIKEYRWPGNLSELHNVLERAAIVASTPMLHIDEGLGVGLDAGQPLGSYRLLERIGAGGVGEVWRARHHMLRRAAAIKLISKDIVSTRNADQRERLLRRFEREAQATAGLRSPHTVELFDFGIADDDSLYYVMELLDGLDLEELVRRFGPVPAERAIYFLRQICRSLAEAHALGLIHRDIKSANVFSCRVGIEHDFVKVLDFGLVKAAETAPVQETGLTAEGTVHGTPAYMPPEIALGDTEVDGRADIYAVGCVAFWLLTGQLVFSGSTPMKLIVQHINETPVAPSQLSELDIPPALDDIVLACLAKNPNDRPRTARELDRLLSQVPLRSSWTPDRAEQWWKRNLPAT